MFENIENELNRMYKTCKFKIIEQNDNIEIFYNDEKLKNNEEFMDNVFAICEKYLKDEDLWRVAILFDYLNEIDKISKNIELTSKFKYSYKQQEVENIKYKVLKLEERFNKIEEDIKFITKEVNRIKSENTDIRFNKNECGIKTVYTDLVQANYRETFYNNNVSNSYENRYLC